MTEEYLQNIPAPVFTQDKPHRHSCNQNHTLCCIYTLLDQLEEESRDLLTTRSSEMIDKIIDLRRQMMKIFANDPMPSALYHNSYTESGILTIRYWDFP